MSIHPSLKLSEKDKKQRAVLKRTERLRIMLEKNEWKPEEKVFGLPKIKTLRIKIKKEKVAKEVEAIPTEGAPTVTETKEQTLTKGPAVKGQDKK